MDISEDGAIAVYANYDRKLAAVDLRLEKRTWTIQLRSSAYVLRIYRDCVIVPVNGSEMLVLDVHTGAMLHKHSFQGVFVYGLALFAGLIESVSYDHLITAMCRSPAKQAG